MADEKKKKYTGMDLSTGEFTFSDGSREKAPGGKPSGGSSSSSSSTTKKPSGGGGSSWLYGSDDHDIALDVPSGPMTGKYTGGNTSLDSALDYYSKMYAEAKAKGDVRGMRNANDEANKWRNKYGYTAEYATQDTNSLLQQQGGGGSGGLNLGGGSIGGGSISGGMPEKPGGFEGVNQAAIDKLLDEVLNRDSFAYDPSTDPIYQNYLKQYQREGQRATDDTLARVAAQAGGMNSYAVTAAQQAGDYYAGKAADVIPELYEAAYGKYLDGIEGKVRDLGLLQDMDATQYNRYRDTMSDWRGDRDFAYGAIRDQVGDQRYNQEWNYQVGRDQVGDQRYEQEWAYQKEQDALDRQYKQDADSYNRAMDRWQMLGYLDEEGARALGIPAGTQTSDYRFKLAAAARASSGGGGGSSGGGKSQDYDGLYAAAYASPNPQNYISSNYKKYGFTSASGLADGFKNWRNGEADNGQRLYTNDFDTLVTYARKMQGAGRDPDYMYDALKTQGYSDAVIDQVFAALGL